MEEKQEIEHKAQMLSFRFLSELELLCKKKDVNKKELAEMMGTSASYITQLFRGHKMVNMAFVAKIEYIFNVQFDIRVSKAKPIKWHNTQSKQTPHT